MGENTEASGAQKCKQRHAALPSVFLASIDGGKVEKKGVCVRMDGFGMTPVRSSSAERNCQKKRDSVTSLFVWTPAGAKN